MDERSFYKQILQDNVVDKEQLLREIKAQKAPAKLINFRKVSALVATFVVLIGVIGVSYSLNFSNAFTKDDISTTQTPFVEPRMVSFNPEIDQYFSQSKVILVGEVSKTQNNTCDILVKDVLRGSFENSLLTLNANQTKPSNKMLVFVNEFESDNQTPKSYNICFYNQENNSFWLENNPDEIFYLSDYLN